MKVNVVPPSNWYETLGVCKTPLTNINNTAFKSIWSDNADSGSTSNDSNWPLKNNGNLLLDPVCISAILSIKSNSPNCQDE